MSQKAYQSGSKYPELKKGKLRIYSSRVCPYAERARLVLAHKNIDHEVVNIDLKNKPEWFLEKAPMGKVPVIEVDDKIINESTAVSEYLDDVYPGDKLQQNDPHKKAMDRILLEQFGQFTSQFYFIIMNTGKEDKKDEIEAKGDTMVNSLKYYEGELAKRDATFFGGVKPAMIDYYLWPHFERIATITMTVPRVAITKDEYPKLTNWWNEMVKVPAVKKEMFDSDWHIQIRKLAREGKRTGDYGLED